ncbi:translation initiation factor IF-3 [Candidatus Peregrinibacteria bacterium]|nr:translation initiation factor IF-3 [Candidatus Peregrinibacteria bacterium]MBT4056179.1 translation initiation factor IF-3 [Candidatus Peregrinibacteria bacterium]
MIDENDEQKGIMGYSKALEMAKNSELDLVEVAPNANPPVCKILDYGKYLYHQDKVERKHKKAQKKTEVKGVRIGFKTGEHDLEVRERQARKFLEERNMVKVTLLFKGREVVYAEMAKEKMNKFYERLSDLSDMEQAPKRQGNTLLMILTPKKNEAKDTQGTSEESKDS